MDKEELKKLNEGLIASIKGKGEKEPLYWLNKGAHVNALDENGRTPLLNAIASGQFFTMKVLMRYGADARIVDNNGVSCKKILNERLADEKYPWEEVRLKGYIKYLEALEYYGPNNKKEMWDQETQQELDNGFYQAVKEQNIEKANEFLKEGANLYHREYITWQDPVYSLTVHGKWMSAFDLAQESGNRQLIDFLDEKKNLNQEFFHMIEKNDTSKLWDLYLQKVEAKGYSAQGETALTAAARVGAKQVFDLLLTHFGLDVNQQDKEGKTALMWAAKENDVTLLNILDCMFAEDWFKDKEGKFALFYAAENGALEAVKKLTNWEETDKISTAIRLANQVGAKNVVDYLVNYEKTKLISPPYRVQTQQIQAKGIRGDFQREG